MKEIIIKSLDIHYFKGIKNLHIDFSEITTISGDNGLGKTTIADAFFWVLFNKDSLGRTKFRIRTIGEKNVDTYVDVYLTIDGQEQTLRKQLIVKQNDYGTDQNDEQSVTSKFYINGQSYTKKDFDAHIQSIITESAFRTITSPTYFFSLKWQEQRALLSQLVHPVSDSDININGEYDDIEYALQRIHMGDIEAMAKHTAYQLKEIKQKLDLIPVQLTEVESVTPEEHDWEKIKVDISNLNEQLQQKQELLAQLKSGSSSAKNDTIRHQIEFQQKRIDEIRESSRKMQAIEQEKYDSYRRDMNIKLSEYRQSLEDIQLKLQGLFTRIAQTRMTIDEQKREQERIRKEWDARVKAQFVCPPVSDVCPACGQPLPLDAIKEAKQNLLDEYNLKKAEAKKELTERANVTKGIILHAENDIKSYESEMTLVQGQQEAVKKYIANIEEKIINHAKTAPHSAQEIMEINEGYKDAVKRIAELQERLSSDVATDNSEVILTTQQQITEITTALDVLRDAMAERTTCEKLSARRDELVKQQESLRSQYDDLQRRADLCVRYQLRSGEILEERINKHFKYVKFSLFRRLVNGTTEPYCEGYVDGVPYQTNINSASRLNCGLDVCNAFSRHIEVSAPIFIDNAESNNHIIETTGQQVRLYVSTSKKLIIS